MNQKTIISIIAIAVLVAVLVLTLRGFSSSSTDPQVDTPAEEVAIPPVGQVPQGNTVIDASQLIGLSEPDAFSYASQFSQAIRVVELDGQSLPVTADFVPGRINAVVTNGLISSYTIEGQELSVDPEPNAGQAEMFAGTFQEYGTGCFADGECYAMVDDKKITTIIGFSQEVSGTFENPDMPIGTQVEVYAQKVSPNIYTLYGSEDYYIREITQ